MKKTIDRFHPVISVEVGDLDTSKTPASKELITFLVDRGYQPYEFRGGKIIQHALKSEPYGYDNILFIHKIHKIP